MWISVSKLELIEAGRELTTIEQKLDFLIKGQKYLTQAYDALSAEITLAVTDIAALATLINDKVAGTSDTDLATLTANLKTATDAVVAVLAPPVVAAPVAAPVVAPATTPAS
jgi:hypothetical protein